ncbi:hypothetical protein [Paraburkholderia tropica]
MNWLYWAAGIAVADVMIVVFNYGAHRKKTDRESRRMRARAMAWKDSEQH